MRDATILPLTIVLIEDDATDVELVQRLVFRTSSNAEPWRLIHVPTLAAAIELLDDPNTCCDVFLLSLSLPEGLDGVRRLALAVENSNAAIVSLAAARDEALGIEAVSLGSIDCLCKEETWAQELPRVIRYAVALKQHQRKLAVAVEATQHAKQPNNANGESLASVTHEIRTQMNVVLGFTQLITKEEDLPGRVRERVGAVGKAGEKLMMLIEDLDPMRLKGEKPLKQKRAELTTGPQMNWRLRSDAGEIRVLAVDDNELNREFLFAILTASGFLVRDASDGVEALQQFEEWKPHVVLMDRRMPRMSGLEATRRIKQSPDGESTPIIMISACAFEPEQRQEARDCGTDEFLSKPLSAEALFGALERALNLEFEKEPIPSSAGAPVIAFPEVPPDFDTDCRRRLCDAANTCRHQQLLELEQEVSAVHPDFGAALRSMIDTYQYDRLTEALNQKAS